MAGMGDKGVPNGLPVDEWGVRVNEKSQPVGSCVACGGATNDAAAVYAVTKAIGWLQTYAPQEALDSLCAEQEKVMARIEKSGVQGDLGPKMTEEQDPLVWLDEPGSPVAKLENEKPMGETIAYDELIKSWQK